MLNKISLKTLNLLFIEFIILSCYKDVFCYPIEKYEIEEKPESRDEKYYPNGTVVGKYTYSDKEGNPVQVKYFADDSSYGVELKSIKVIDSSSVLPQSLNKINPVDKLTKSPDLPPFKIVPGFLNEKYFTERNNYKGSDHFKYFKNVAKVNHLNLDKSSPDYDVFYESEIKGPKKCGKDKVRIYLEKQKRKTRNTLNEHVMPKFCEII